MVTEEWKAGRPGGAAGLAGARARPPSGFSLSRSLGPPAFLKAATSSSREDSKPPLEHELSALVPGRPIMAAGGLYAHAACCCAWWRVKGDWVASVPWAVCAACARSGGRKTVGWQVGSSHRHMNPRASEKTCYAAFRGPDRTCGAVPSCGWQASLAVKSLRAHWAERGLQQAADISVSATYLYTATETSSINARDEGG